MSASAEVTCEQCGQSLGDQYRPGDGIALFKAHQPECPNPPKAMRDGVFGPRTSDLLRPRDGQFGPATSDAVRYAP